MSSWPGICLVISFQEGLSYYNIQMRQYLFNDFAWVKQITYIFTRNGIVIPVHLNFFRVQEKFSRSVFYWVFQKEFLKVCYFVSTTYHLHNKHSHWTVWIDPMPFVCVFLWCNAYGRYHAAYHVNGFNCFNKSSGPIRAACHCRDQPRIPQRLCLFLLPPALAEEVIFSVASICLCVCLHSADWTAGPHNLSKKVWPWKVTQSRSNEGHTKLKKKYLKNKLGPLSNVIWAMHPL